MITDSETLDRLTQRIREVRDANGWRPTTWESGSFSSRCMGVLRELDEFEEAMVQPDPDFMLELADVLTYLLIIMSDLGVRAVVSAPHPRAKIGMHGPQVTSMCLDISRQARHYVLRAWNQWRRFNHDPIEVLMWLQRAVDAVLAIEVALDMPLDKAVLTKCDINMTRGPRHGGKHPDT